MFGCCDWVCASVLYGIEETDNNINDDTVNTAIRRNNSLAGKRILAFTLFDLFDVLLFVILFTVQR